MGKGKLTLYHYFKDKKNKEMYVNNYAGAEPVSLAH